MAVPGIATLPGAPLTLARLTPGLASPPPELVSLRAAVASVVAGLDGPGVVVCPSDAPTAWIAGDLGLGGFGTGDPPQPWNASPAGKEVVAQLGLAPRTDDIPTEGRVVARLLDADVAAIVGMPAASDDLARSVVDAAAGAELSLVAVGDLSASIGPDSPRPGNAPDLDGLVIDGVVDTAVLGRMLEGPDAALAAALQVLLEDQAPTLRGAVHVVRGVATLVASVA